ncbi:MAG: uncharacterized protein KVP18_001665 [Porospora cf. gigantea A]|uniref:uncharacterized protein n=1 Tax=Porospora cf. gigantea A TaxID=2853593 RepID=UPI00355A2817|nr:MAG: hypothetical protein KVP18_001665 [Porospora cf. gigantea A]
MDREQYLHSHVDPMLEDLATSLIISPKEDPVVGAINILLRKFAKSYGFSREDMCQYDIVTLASELKALRSETSVNETALGRHPTIELRQSSFFSSSEAESDDDSVYEPEPRPAAGPRRPRGSVSAEVYGEHNPRPSSTPPAFPKTEAQTNVLRDFICGPKPFFFRGLASEEVDLVLDAMMVHNVPMDTVLIREGDEGEHLYFIYSGSFKCEKLQGGRQVLVREYFAGDFFGELAVLYWSPRAATLTALQDSVVMSLKRCTLNHIRSRDDL